MDISNRYSYAARVMTAKDIKSALAIMDLYAMQVRPTATVEEEWTSELDGIGHINRLSCGHNAYAWCNYCPMCGAMILEDEDDDTDL